MKQDDLASMLGRGNVSPSPGPDDWEKWALAKSGDECLAVVVNLANYVIRSNYFPPVLKQNFITPIYKKADMTNPLNYRGIVLANLLQVVIASWFTYNLSQYAWSMGLIPRTQIATQPGTRVSDMTHLLSALDGHACFLKRIIYVLKARSEKRLRFHSQIRVRGRSEVLRPPTKRVRF